METIPYLSIYIVALLYFILLLIMFSFKNSKLYDSFAYLILSFTVWSWGAVFMRTFLFPGPEIWFRVSFGALMISPLFLYMFLLDYFETTYSSKKMTLVTICTLTITISSFFGIWCDTPTAKLIADHTVGFYYNIDLRMAPVLIWILYLFYMCFDVLKGQEKTRAYKDILTGISIIIIGCILTIVPENIFPFSAIGGMVGTFFLTSALYRKKLFKVNNNITHSSLLFMAYITVCFLALPYIRLRIRKDASILSSGKFIAVWVSASLMTLFISMIFIWISKKLFFNRGEKLVNESRNYAQALLQLKGDRTKITDLLRKTLNNLYGDVSTLLYLVEKDNTYMDIYRSTIEDPDLNPRIWLDGRFATLSKIKSLPIRTEEALQELGIRDNKKKAQTRRYKLEYTIPLIANGSLIGLLFAGGDKLTKLSQREVKNLAAIANSTSIALRSANMLDDLKWELTQDHKTGLYNRQNYLPILQNRLQSSKPLTLIVYDIDDFKLFTQVYSVNEADKVPPIFAECMKKVASRDMILCRYSSKSFNILINGETEDALDFDQRLRTVFKKKTEGTIFSCIGFSGGCNTSRGNYKDANKFISVTRQAVKRAKTNGKNYLEVFSEDMIEDPSLNETGFDLGTAEAVAKAIDMKDKYTFQHSNNVACYAKILAKAAGLDPYEQQLIYESGLVHDVGKIAIPDDILTKPGRLTPEEYEIIKTHVVKSEVIIKASAHGHLLYPLVECHHERWDGKGYPNGKKGLEIPIGGRCLAIADSFDAMTGKRVYKNSMTIEEARAELIRCRGTQFDPELTDIFVKLLDDKTITLNKSC